MGLSQQSHSADGEGTLGTGGVEHRVYEIAAALTHHYHSWTYDDYSWLITTQAGIPRTQGQRGGTIASDGEKSGSDGEGIIP